MSLHDASLTVALLELGIEPVGWHGRTRADGTPHSRSSATATGTDFDNSDIAFIGNLPVDVERVAAADLDLIVTTSWLGADPDRLRRIDPGHEGGRRSGTHVATWRGTGARPRRSIPASAMPGMVRPA